MADLTLAQTICELTRVHLENNNGLLLGQAVSAVGWVNGTVPDCKNIVELPMTDVAGAGFAVGAAMVGRRPIFVLRFQDFFQLNGSQIINYAAKSKELHDCPSPIFVRMIGADGIGPVHSGVLHNIPMHFPGMKVFAPMTPMEYKEAWNAFMEGDDPVIVSEHRRAFNNSQEWPNEIAEKADITLYGISDARIEMMQAAEDLRKGGLKVNTVHIKCLKPLEMESLKMPLKSSKKGIVIDNGYEICGASQSIAYELAKETGHFVYALGLTDHTKCLAEGYKNMTPDKEKIVNMARKIIEVKY